MILSPILPPEDSTADASEKEPKTKGIAKLKRFFSLSMDVLISSDKKTFVFLSSLKIETTEASSRIIVGII